MFRTSRRLSITSATLGAALIVAASATTSWAGLDAGAPRLTSARVGAFAARSRKRPRRPGCGTYCQQAGGLGAGPGAPPPVDPVQILDKRASVSGGAALIHLRCKLKVPCNGAITIDHVGSAPFARLGAADLTLGAKRRGTIAVALNAQGRALMHRVHQAKVDVAVFQSSCRGHGSCGTAGASDRMILLSAP